MGFPLETVISSGSNLLGGLVNQIFADKAAKKAYQRQLDFWNKQNEYNLPSAQMERLAAAGLNPNLVYGSSATTMSAQLSSVRPSSAELGSGIAAAGNVVAQTALLKAQKANIDADTELKKQESEKKGTEIDLNRFDLANIRPAMAKRIENESELKGQELELFKKTFDNRVSISDSEVELKIASVRNMMWQTTKLEKLFGENSPVIRNLESSTELNQARVAYTKASTSLTYAQISAINMSINKMISEITLNSKRSDLIDSSINVNGSVIRLNNGRVNQTDIQNMLLRNKVPYSQVNELSESLTKFANIFTGVVRSASSFIY